jgi:hypothetical protein
MTRKAKAKKAPKPKEDTLKVNISFGELLKIAAHPEPKQEPKS